MGELEHTSHYISYIIRPNSAHFESLIETSSIPKQKMGTENPKQCVVRIVLSLFSIHKFTSCYHKN